MSRAATGDTVVLKASSNIYTVLSLAAVIAQIMALVVVFMQAPKLGVKLF